MTAVTIGIDVGGTHLRVGVVARDGTLEVVSRRPTPRTSPGELVDALVEGLGPLDADLPVGVGIAGMVVDGVLRFSPNLPYEDLDVADVLHARTSRRVTVVNDATAAAFGEHRAGVARGFDDVVMFTLGTGVGGGVVVGGEPLVGAHGLAGEVGHVVVEPWGRSCSCGLVGCLEAHASATSIARIHAERTDLRPGAEPLTASQVAGAARDGDVVARQVVEQAADTLGRVAATLVTVLDPGIIVLGGGAAPALAPLMAPVIAERLRTHVFGARHRTLPDVRAAALGDDAGIVGAGLLAVHPSVRVSTSSRPTDRGASFRS